MSGMNNLSVTDLPFGASCLIDSQCTVQYECVARACACSWEWMLSPTEIEGECAITPKSAWAMGSTLFIILCYTLNLLFSAGTVLASFTIDNQVGSKWPTTGRIAAMCIFVGCCTAICHQIISIEEAFMHGMPKGTAPRIVRYMQVLTSATLMAGYLVVGMMWVQMLRATKRLEKHSGGLGVMRWAIAAYLVIFLVFSTVLCTLMFAGDGAGGIKNDVIIAPEQAYNIFLILLIVSACVIIVTFQIASRSLMSIIDTMWNHTEDSRGCCHRTLDNVKRVFNCNGKRITDEMDTKTPLSPSVPQRVLPQNVTPQSDRNSGSAGDFSVPDEEEQRVVPKAKGFGAVAAALKKVTIAADDMATQTDAVTVSIDQNRSVISSSLENRLRVIAVTAQYVSGGCIGLMVAIVGFFIASPEYLDSPQLRWMMGNVGYGGITVCNYFVVRYLAKTLLRNNTIFATFKEYAASKRDVVEPIGRADSGAGRRSSGEFGPSIVERERDDSFARSDTVMSGKV